MSQTPRNTHKKPFLFPQARLGAQPVCLYDTLLEHLWHAVVAFPLAVCIVNIYGQEPMFILFAISICINTVHVYTVCAL